MRALPLLLLALMALGDPPRADAKGGGSRGESSKQGASRRKQKKHKRGEPSSRVSRHRRAGAGTSRKTASSAVPVRDRPFQGGRDDVTFAPEKGKEPLFGTTAHARPPKAGMKQRTELAKHRRPDANPRHVTFREPYKPGGPEPYASAARVAAAPSGRTAGEVLQEAHRATAAAEASRRLERSRKGKERLPPGNR